MAHGILSIAIAAVFATACGSSSSSTGNTGAGGTAGSSGTGGGVSGSAGNSSGGAGAGSGGVSGTGGGGTAGSVSSVCPSSTPAVGSTCTPEGRDCSFGDSPLPECRTNLVCAQAKWAKGTNPTMCVNTPPSVCPASVPPAQTACDMGNVGARCAYPSGSLCGCVDKLCGGTGCTNLPSPQWVCNQVTAGCPLQPPNAGDTCDGSHPLCEYEYCGLTTQCTNGVWVWMFGCA